MSSSFKQKKMKTLATRKKTRKRRMQLGLTVDDDSGRLFQPPSKRDPRWKKPSLDALVTEVVKRQKVSHDASGDDDDDDDDADDSDASRANQAASDDNDDDDDADSGDEEEADAPQEVARVPIRLCKSLDDCAAQAEAKHREIRRGDGRQKAKVLMLVDAQSLFKAIKTKMGVRAEPIRSKSRVGIRSQKQTNNVAFRHIGALKTPMERFHDANKEVLRDFKSGKLPSLLAEDMSFFPYSDLRLQHVIYVAKRVATLTAIDCSLLSEGTTPHFYLLSEALSADDREALEDQAFEIVQG